MSRARGTREIKGRTQQASKAPLTTCESTGTRQAGPGQHRHKASQRHQQRSWGTGSTARGQLARPAHKQSLGVPCMRVQGHQARQADRRTAWGARLKERAQQASKPPGPQCTCEGRATKRGRIARPGHGVGRTSHAMGVPDARAVGKRSTHSPAHNAHASALPRPVQARERG